MLNSRNKSLAGRQEIVIESIEPRTMFAFGDADAAFAVAGRVTATFANPSKTPTITQLLVTSGGKILAGGTTGLVRFTSAGAIDATFGTAGKITLSAAANFIGEGVDPSTNNIYVLISAAGGTGLLRYSANGKLDTTFGSGGTISVTSSKTFSPQAIAVQADSKVLIAGVFKTDNSTGRKVRVYRLKSDGSSDTGFGASGAFEFNLGVGNFLAPTIFDKVTKIAVVAGGKIDIIGGSINFAQSSEDPDTGNFTPTTYDKAVFAVARLTTAGALDSGYGSSGIARSDYATADNINATSIEPTLPTAAAVRSNDSVVIAGTSDSATVAEFSASGSVLYTAVSPGASQLRNSVALTTLSDGRSILVALPTGSIIRGLAVVAIASDGTFGNIVYTGDSDDSTADLDQFTDGRAAAVSSDGRLLVGGRSGLAVNAYEVEKFLVGSVNDARPDEFADARANDIVKDTAGGLHLAYYDAATTHLVYAHRNPNGMWSANKVIDTGANAGQYVSIDVNSKGNAGIAYFDGTAGDLKLAQFNGKKWIVETVDSKGSVGLYPSFTYDNADEPVVTYYNKTKGQLTFALKKANTTWGYENVDGSGDNVGRSSVLVASPTTNRYTVAYVDNTTGSVMWAGHEKGGTWQVKEAAKTKGGADFLGMAYGASYAPMISYYDAFASDLKISAYYNNKFNVKTLATSGAQGLYTSAFFPDYYGTGAVIAYNKSQDKATVFKNVLSDSPISQDVVTGGGKYLAVDSDGVTTDFAFFDIATGKLKVRPGPALQ